MTDTNQYLQALIATIKTLRGEGGCPWDGRQTSKSLTKYIKSECDELIDAINEGNPQNICEESGDLLYLIIMLAEINNDVNAFTLKDIILSIDKKLIRRHPHVFAGTPYKDEEELKQQWEAIKIQEKSKKSV